MAVVDHGIWIWCAHVYIKNYSMTGSWMRVWMTYFKIGQWNSASFLKKKKTNKRFFHFKYFIFIWIYIPFITAIFPTPLVLCVFSSMITCSLYSPQVVWAMKYLKILFSYFSKYLIFGRCVQYIRNVSDLETWIQAPVYVYIHSQDSGL